MLLADGGVTWIVDDIRDSHRVGEVIASLYLPDGYVKANGATVNRADYPRLVAMITKYSLWTSNTASNLGLFGVGNGTTTMVLPNWTGRMAKFSATAGDTVAAGLPNITGTLQSNRLGITNNYGYAGEGALTTQETTVHDGWYGAGIDDNLMPVTIAFNASLCNALYGASTTVQPPAINVIPCMKY